MLISPTWVKTKYMYVCTEIKYVETRAFSSYMFVFFLAAFY